MCFAINTMYKKMTLESFIELNVMWHTAQKSGLQSVELSNKIMKIQPQKSRSADEVST